MRMLVVGAGSTGGYFGGRLAQAGRDVTFLVRPARAAQLQADGLQIRSPHGDFTLKPQFLTATQTISPFEIVLLAVKAYSLDAALEDLAAAVGPSTMILPLLNGMKHVERLRARFGEQALVGCACKVATFLDAQGRIVQLSALQQILYGEMDGSMSPRMEQLDAFMQGAGFDARLSTTIAGEMWEKWVFLATLGSATCLMRGNIGEIRAAPDGLSLVLGILDEVAAIARTAGVAPRETFLAEVRAALTASGSALTSSMYRDLQRGGRIEADQIVGDLLLRGRQSGIATPLLSAVYTHLMVYQNRLRAAPLKDRPA
jgi:2-dehydropantoate 2-reductase